jgi:hypothetical protein
MNLTTLTFGIVHAHLMNGEVEAEFGDHQAELENRQLPGQLLPDANVRPTQCTFTAMKKTTYLFKNIKIHKMWEII